MLSTLLLGLLVGLRHALEADHVAAVVSLVTRGGSAREHAAQGALWGLGHTLTLLLLAGGSLLLGVAIPDAVSRLLEAGVGVMLVALGASVLLGLRRRGIHVHVHEHAGSGRHLHAHAHTPGLMHDAAQHAHLHRHGHGHQHGHGHGPRSLRALAVGAVHGLAGSAALVLLVAGAAPSAWAALAHVALFGLGSVIGMMLLATVIALPLRASAGRAARLHDGLCLGAGAFSVAIGVLVLARFA